MFLPLLRRLSSFFKNHLLKLCGCGDASPIMIPLPNLFCFSSRVLNLLYSGQRGGGSRPSCNRASHSVPTKDYGPPSTTTTHYVSSMPREQNSPCPEIP